MKKRVAWVEIPTGNFERAVKFYNALLGLDLQVINCGKEKMACFPGGEGAISLSPGFKPSDDGVHVSLRVHGDLDSAAGNIQKHGGCIVQPKTKIEAEGRGYFLVFTDTEGNRVGLYSDH